MRVRHGDAKAAGVETGEPATPRQRRRRAALLAAGVFAAGLAALWAERRPIARHVIDDRLAASGVPARYTLADLGPGRQRLTGVVVGDPARPDLVADWVETETGLGLGGPRLVAVRAGGVRVQARLVNGRLSLGALDRLLPKGSGGGFAWPALTVATSDARLRLETSAGTVGAALSGAGRLDGGFTGRLALVGGSSTAGVCAIAAPRAVLRVRTGGADGLWLAGPVSAAAARCAAGLVAAPAGRVDVALRLGGPGWRGTAQLAAPAVRAGGVDAGATTLAVRFDGRPGATAGTVSLTAERVLADAATAAKLAFAGRFDLRSGVRAEGTLTTSGARLAARLLANVAAARGTAAGSPVAPLVDAAAAAAVRAGRSFGGTADLAIVSGSAGGVRLSRAALAAASGATARFTGSLDLLRRTGAGSLALTGGGLPTIAATLTVGDHGATSGVATIHPYAVAGARLALTPVAFAVDGSGAWRASTRATLSGPLAGGRVDGLSLPLALRGNGDKLLLGERCAEAALERLRLGTLALARTRWTLCPAGEALVVAGRGGLSGGVVVAEPRLAGTLGGSPLAVTADRLRLDWRERRFAAAGLAASLGRPDSATRLAFASLDGRIGPGGIGGSFAGGGGRIGAVPLALSDAAGRWTAAGGRLDVSGTMTVADVEGGGRACAPAAAAVAAGMRFCPLAARDVTLRLADGRIAAAGTLVEPRSGTRVAGVTIAHDLGDGSGHADLTVASLSFSDKLQPDALTPLTFGVVADVAGTIDGTGRIAWGRDGVTSTGRFATAGLDLAASFGPVQGIEGAVAFTDLIGLVSAPSQRLTVRSINPGVPVENGTVRFHLEPGSRVAVEDARWPFAGGTLTLDPTLLDFGAKAERHLTFRVAGVAADRFLQQFDFRNLAATGTFDGVLPMVFDADGGRIENGSLTVREGGGTIAYVGELGRKQLGFWGDLAFQALKSLRYRSLAIAMNGPLAGEMLTEVRFAGVSQGEGAKSNFLVRRLQRLPFVFNVRIRAPFRGLVDTTSSFGDPRGLIRRNLPGLMKEGAVQPPASAPVP